MYYYGEGGGIPGGTTPVRISVRQFPAIPKLPQHFAAWIPLQVVPCTMLSPIQQMAMPGALTWQVVFAACQFALVPIQSM